MQILVLDDYYDEIAPALNVYGKGNTIEYVATPRDAENKMDHKKYDVLLLDGNLRSTTGPEVLKRWYASGRVVPPVVMISGSEELNKKGIAAGAVWFVEKGRFSEEFFEELKQKLLK